ncbi:MAG: hypothetical protein H7X74_01490, partial [Methyloceanibacter sp.]|nr:hypothetical protein [Methyloceanibacter sp.]
TTIAGLVIHEGQTIPNPGQAFTFHEYRFEALRRQRNRITSLRVTPIAPKRGQERGQQGLIRGVSAPRAQAR